MTAGLLVLVVAAAVVWRSTTGERDDLGDGARGEVAVPAPDGAVRGTGSAEARDSAVVAWSRAHADGAVVATPERVVVGRSGAAAADPVQPAEVLDRTTGAVIAAVGGDGTSWHPLGDDGRRILLAVEDRELVLLDPAGGPRGGARQLGEVAVEEEQLSGTSHRLRRAFLDRSDVFLHAGSSLYALELPTGEEPGGAGVTERWRWSDQHVLSAGITAHGPYAVVVDGVVALDAATGEVRWRRRLVTFDNRSHVVHRGVLVIADDDGQVTGLDARTGAVRWQQSLGGGLTTGLTPMGGIVVGVSAAGSVHAYEVASGDVVWRLHLAEVELERVVATAHVLVATGPPRQRPATVVAVAADGSQRWVRSVPAVADLGVAPGGEGGAGLVVMAAGDGVAAIDARTGAQRWSLSLEGPIDVVDIGANVLLATPDRVVAVPVDGGLDRP